MIAKRKAPVLTTGILLFGGYGICPLLLVWFKIVNGIILTILTPIVPLFLI
jgi:hypothetical protein